MGNSGFISCRCRGIGPHLDMRWGTRGFSAVVGNSVFLSSLGGKLGFPLELQQGIRASSDAVRGKLGFLSRSSRGVEPLFEFQQATLFLSSFDGNLSVPLMLQQGSQSSSRVQAGNSGFPPSCSRGVEPPLELGGYTRSSS